MPRFSIETPVNIKSELQAIYASEEQCYALITLNQFEIEGGSDDEDLHVINNFQIDADVFLPIEVYVINQSDEWVQEKLESITVYKDNDIVSVPIYSKDSVFAQEILTQLYPGNKDLHTLYLKSDVSFTVTDNDNLFASVNEQTEPTVVDVTNSEEANKENACESFASTLDDAKQNEAEDEE